MVVPLSLNCVSGFSGCKVFAINFSGRALCRAIINVRNTVRKCQRNHLRRGLTVEGEGRREIGYARGCPDQKWYQSKVQLAAA